MSTNLNNSAIQSNRNESSQISVPTSSNDQDANIDSNNTDAIPTKTTTLQQQQISSSQRYAFRMEHEEEEEDYENCNIILDGEWDDEDEKRMGSHNNNHDLTTPLLAQNNDDVFMELERSHETSKSLSTPTRSLLSMRNNNDEYNNIILKNFGDRSKKQKRLTWDKETSNLKVQWLDQFNSNHEMNDEGDEEGHNNNHNHGTETYTITNNYINHNHNNMNISIASVFLRDYEYSRPCSLSPNFDSITPLQLEMYNLRFSSSHQFLVSTAMITLFLASCFEGQSENGVLGIIFQILFTSFAVLIFTMDIVMRAHYDDDNLFTMNIPTLYTRKTRARRWKVPMLIMLMTVTLETTIRVLMNTNTLIVWSSLFKPIVFFYVSSKSRDALYALMKVSKIVFKVIVIELFLMLSFSAMACHLYFDFDAFKDLPTSFLSLFEISTTVITPSLWLPVYNKHDYSVFFFVTFLIICVFYMHSLVLSVVFQIYIQAMKLIRERAIADRQEALNLAFLALRRKHDTECDEETNLVNMRDIKSLMKLLRPHYNDAKIDVLVQIVDPNGSGKIDFNTFRVQIPKAIQTSLRSARQSTRNSLILESLAFCIAVANVVYVLLLSSALEFLMLANLIIPLGTLIVLLGLCETVFRIRPLPILQNLSTNRHVFLDSLAIFSGLTSLCGLIAHAFDKDQGLQALLLGRAIDMIRLLRFSSIFRSIVDRTGDVLPALVGPIVLVISSLHIYTYTGMALWEGAVTVGKEQSIQPLYDLNNFNDYTSGLLTMFNIFVVNDWHKIAEVYLFADRFNSPYIVYPFFISAILIGVNILLNVLAAFFVGSFVTKVETNTTGSTGSSQTNKTSQLKLRMSSRQKITDSTEFNLSTTRTSDSLGNDGTTGFHVFERQGYDTVMKTITGDEDVIAFAKQACELLKVFEKLMPTTDQIGYLMCCQQSRDCFGNRHFIPMTREYIEEDKIHGVIDEMFTDLMNIDQDTVQRDFPPLLSDDMYHQHLILSASFCNSNPPVCMFVASKKWISAVV